MEVGSLDNAEPQKGSEQKTSRNDPSGSTVEGRGGGLLARRLVPGEHVGEGRMAV